MTVRSSGGMLSSGVLLPDKRLTGFAFARSNDDDPWQTIGTSPLT
jgi:hypothetical protein